MSLYVRLQICSTLVSSSNSVPNGSWFRNDSNSSEGSKSTVSTLLANSSPVMADSNSPGAVRNGASPSDLSSQQTSGSRLTFLKQTDDGGSGGDCHVNCCHSDLPGLRSSYCHFPEFAGDIVMSERERADGPSSKAGHYDLDVDRGASPGASLLGLEDAFVDRFVIDGDDRECDKSGRLRLQRRHRRPLETDSDSEDPCSTAGTSRYGGSRHHGGRGTASTTSLNDFLDGDGCNIDGSDLTSAADDSAGDECDGVGGGGACERSLDDSDYERLVVGHIAAGGPVDDDRLLSPVLVPPPRFCRRQFRSSPQLPMPAFPIDRRNGHVNGHVNGLGNGPQAVNGFRLPPFEFSKHAIEKLSDDDDDDYEDDAGDYTHLAEEGLPTTASSGRSLHHSTGDAESDDGDRLYCNVPCSSSAQSIGQLPELPTRCSDVSPVAADAEKQGGDCSKHSVGTAAAAANGVVVSPSTNRVLLRRRKGAKLSSRSTIGFALTSTPVRGSIANGRFHGSQTNGNANGVYVNGVGGLNGSCRGRAVFSTNSLSSSTSSCYDGSSSLGSREWIGCCHPSETSETIIRDQPASASMDDGYCTARSGRPLVADDTRKSKVGAKRFPFSRPLNWIASSSEDVANARNGIGSRSASVDGKDDVIANESTDGRDEPVVNGRAESVGNSKRSSTGSAAPNLNRYETDPDSRWMVSSRRYLSESRLTEPDYYWEPLWTDVNSAVNDADVGDGPGALHGGRSGFHRSLSDPGFLLSQSLASRSEYVCDMRSLRNEADCSLDSSLVDEVNFRRALDMFAFLDDQDVTSAVDITV